MFEKTAEDFPSVEDLRDILDDLVKDFERINTDEYEKLLTKLK